MTTRPKLLVIAAIATVSVAVYEARRASHLQEEIRTLRQQKLSLADQIQRLERERDDASNRLRLLAGEHAALKDDSAEVRDLREEVSQLKAAAPSDAIQSRTQS